MTEKLDGIRLQLQLGLLTAILHPAREIFSLGCLQWNIDTQSAQFIKPLGLELGARESGTTQDQQQIRMQGAGQLADPLRPLFTGFFTHLQLEDLPVGEQTHGKTTAVQLLPVRVVIGGKAVAFGKALGGSGGPYGIEGLLLEQGFIAE